MSKYKISTAIPVVLPKELTRPFEMIFMEHNYAAVSHNIYVKVDDRTYLEFCFPNLDNAIEYFEDLYRMLRAGATELTNLSEDGFVGYEKLDLDLLEQGVKWLVPRLVVDFRKTNGNEARHIGVRRLNVFGSNRDGTKN